jgi:uncharacterized membrane protein YjgN (DUF898 family)
MQNKKNQRGSAILIELLIALCITMTFMAMSTVSVVKIRAAQNTSQARMRLIQVADSVSAANICNQTQECAVSPALIAQIPAYGLIQQSGYAYSMTDLGGGNFSYVATPISPMTGSTSFYISGDMILRCGTTATSPACQ